ncbi:MAG TPA: DUF535 family protein [Sphingomicrobium sp.]|nr:DUF535 family protein [Sphingomicrobium sp.]
MYQLLAPDKLCRRALQLGYLLRHPLSHRDCSSAVRHSRTSSDRVAPLKYIGNYLALSLNTAQRRTALIGHHELLAKVLTFAGAEDLRLGVEVWKRDVAAHEPPLRIVLEPARFAPMEGELQLRFIFRSDLYVLTFLIAPGRTFGREAPTVLFIGGLQGLIGARQEIRDASRLNREIAPKVMLLIAVQVIAEVAGASEILAVSENDQVSMAYAPSLLMFDYHAFWSEVGAVGVGSCYAVPLKTPQKPLAAIPLTHRRRTRRKREEKDRIRFDIMQSLSRVFRR